MKNSKALYLSQELRLLLEMLVDQAYEECKALEGKRLVWAINPTTSVGRVERPYKGREAQIVNAIWDNRTGAILFTVRTANQAKTGWLEDNDSFHRTFRCASEFEEFE